MNKFKTTWAQMNKSHDIPIQAELDEVKDDVHEMDEQLDTIEEISQPKKTRKNTVHITYDRNGAPVNSYVDNLDKSSDSITGVSSAEAIRVASNLDTQGKSHEEIVRALIEMGADKATAENSAEPYGKRQKSVASDSDMLQYATWIFNNGYSAMAVGSAREDADVAEAISDRYGVAETKGMEIMRRAKINVGKSQSFTKPGETIHTSKWDDCVKEVNAQGGSVNAYAVCTAQLGDQSFKSQYRHLSLVKKEISKARDHVRKEMGTDFAAPIPNSLLADQDLEDGKEEKSDDDTLDVDAITRKTVLDTFDTMDNTTARNEKMKSETASNLVLNDLAEKAEDADTIHDKDNLVQNIKNAQKKRQKATMKDRGATTKSFKDTWNKLNHG